MKSVILVEALDVKQPMSKIEYGFIRKVTQQRVQNKLAQRGQRKTAAKPPGQPELLENKNQ